VVLGDRADLRAASQRRTHAERAAAVHAELRAHADRSQARLRRLLAASRVAYQPFWIANTVRVTAGRDLLEKITALPEVTRVVADGSARILQPRKGQDQARIQAVEWNIDRIRAPEVWSTFGDRGDGIVVASIDTGVQFDHPALVRQYRGNLGGGTFDHNYNWFDPSQVCGSPSLAPCDNVFHGTHTMGTMVGADGDPGANQIGVAPHAKWIAAKGCETISCSDFALLSAGQWVIAPTDLNGQNPRPDLAPDIVNNSWSDGPGNPFYQDIVTAWTAAGIFGVFANGNNGPGCGTAGSPGDYPASYSVGAFDINNAIADFSSRGPSAFGVTKPDVAAPGVDVRSSVPGGYESFSGTSMATPHVAGTVALIWSAAPALAGDINGTRQLLDDTAVDTEDPQCGGTADDNNVWGEGRLDAFAAVSAAPRGPTGTLTGTVTNQATGAPVQGAAVRATGPMDRTTSTGSDGTYTMVLPVGSYDVTASHFGLLSRTAAGVAVTEGQPTTQDFALAPAPAHPVSGHVRDGSGNALAGATVTIEGTPIAPVTTAADGSYTFAAVPEGEYDVSARLGGCFDPQTQHLVVGGAENLDFTLPQRHDTFGYSCRPAAFDYVDAGTVLPLSGDDASTRVTLPFPVSFYGQTYPTADVATNGFLDFLASDATFFNGPIPSVSPPNGAVYPFWDDLVVDGSASVRTELLGSAPNRRFVVEWRNIAFLTDTSKRVGFEVVLSENGQLTFQYRDIADDGLEKGGSATVGIENETGDDALQYSFNQPLLANQTAIAISPPPSGFVQGTVTDANDGLAVAGARVRALQGGTVVRQATTGSDGQYRVMLPLGTYTIEASATSYATGTAQVVLDQVGQTITRNFALATARAQVSPTSLELTVPPGQTRTRKLTISNTGSLGLDWEIRESPGQPAASGSAQGSGQWLYRSTGGVTARVNRGGQATAFPSAYRWRPASAPAQPSVLVYADDPYHPAPGTYLDQALQRLGAGYTAHYGADFAGFESDLRNQPWDLVLFGDDNYAPPATTLTALNDYVNQGGKLAFATWTVSFNPSPLYGTLGFDWASDDTDPPAPVHFWKPAHPAFTTPESVPELTQLAGGRYAIYGQAGNARTGFEALAGYTTPGPDPNQAALVLGNNERTVFKGFMDGQNDADLDSDGIRDGVELWENLASGLENGFFQDVPWLSESPTSGTLAPGRSQSVTVTVDATGLAPGIYRAGLHVLSNSGRQPHITVPVTLTVPAYFQAVNAGDGDYTDLSGDLWSADRQYPAGGFGYLNTSSRTARTSKPISGTDDDPLYQTQRVDPTEYRFDGLPAGSYQVTLDFAEVMTRQPGTRLFDVIAENTLELPALDVAGEVGSFAADQHTFRVTVTDGQLNIRFVGRRGYAPPIVNAIRVVHQPAG
jgi:subtilisin family serine protease